jgi:hypothetical protein
MRQAALVIEMLDATMFVLSISAPFVWLAVVALALTR